MPSFDIFVGLLVGIPSYTEQSLSAHIARVATYRRTFAFTRALARDLHGLCSISGALRVWSLQDPSVRRIDVWESSFS